jgi:hypothetical protein
LDETKREQYKSVIQWWISSSVWSFLSLNYFSLAFCVYRSNDNIDTTVRSLNPPLSTLSAVRSKSEKHVSLGSVIAWNNNIHNEREGKNKKMCQIDKTTACQKLIYRHKKKRERENSMIDECITRNLGDKIWHKCDKIYWMTYR